MIKHITKYNTPKAYLLITLGMLLHFTSCQRHSDMQSEGIQTFQGVWKEQIDSNKNKLLNYTVHEFKFICDSVYVTMDVHAKTKTIADSCYKNGNWQEFAKAVYVQRGDSILAEGVYTKEDGKQKISGCYKNGQYLPRFKLIYNSSDSIVLQNKFESRPLILKKSKRHYLRT